ALRVALAQPDRRVPAVGLDLAEAGRALEHLGPPGLVVLQADPARVAGAGLHVGPVAGEDVGVEVDREHAPAQELAAAGVGAGFSTVLPQRGQRRSDGSPQKRSMIAFRSTAMFWSVKGAS